MKRALSWLFVLVIWISALSASAEQRFPPPEFESGYKLPVTTTPAPRALLLQYADVIVLAGALAVACFLVHKRRSRKGLVALSIFSLAYFGFYRKGCICSIGSVQNVALALGTNDYSVPLTVAASFVLPLVVALFAGRAFCAGVCPHGALQDLLLIKPIKTPAWLEHALGIIPFIYLGAAVLFAATGSAFVICRYDPFVPLFRMGGSFLMLAIGAGFLVTGLFIGRPYCRYVCPYGALLRVTALVSKWRVTVTPDSCTRCRLCEESCPYGALRHPVENEASCSTVGTDRRRLGRFLLLLPVFILFAGWIGSRTNVALSNVHRDVALAERLPGSEPVVVQPGTQSASELSLARAQQDPKQFYDEALALRRRFVIGGWLLGGWIGFLIGVKLMALSLQSNRKDYEPDRGTCVACARCFLSCPSEHVRRGLLPPLVPGVNSSTESSA